MGNGKLTSDPYNLIIAGVGGQGNVLASRVLGNMLTEKGFFVTIGDTFGASQRGGAVMSHIRVSAESTWSPQIPKGRAHMIIALEPTEAIRVLGNYGNPTVKVLCNTRPIHSVGVICGELSYPALEEVKKWVCELSEQAWFVDATDIALALGDTSIRPAQQSLDVYFGPRLEFAYAAFQLPSPTHLPIWYDAGNSYAEAEIGRASCRERV